MTVFPQSTGKMFSFITGTWNPVVGCTHLCKYCWARKLANGKLKHLPQYGRGFKPTLVESALEKKFKPGECIFVCDMGDLFCKGVPDAWVFRVLDVIRAHPLTTFLLLTKNPRRYLYFLHWIPPNAILGATIESDLPHEGISGAPSPEHRLFALALCRELERLVNGFEHKRFVAIEPVMQFDHDKFLELLRRVNPWAVAVGYDNYDNSLPEPSLAETERLIADLRNFTGVHIKTLREGWNVTTLEAA